MGTTLMSVLAAVYDGRCEALTELRHAENILSGRKQVELRRRSMRLKAGTIVWMYVKLPIGQIVGYAHASTFHWLAPSTLWRRFANVSGLTRSEFFGYFEGLSKGFALGLEDPKQLPSHVSLEELRQVSAEFQPPQFFARLVPGSPLQEFMAKRRIDVSDEHN